MHIDRTAWTDIISPTHSAAAFPTELPTGGRDPIAFATMGDVYLISSSIVRPSIPIDDEFTSGEYGVARRGGEGEQESP